MALRQYVYMYNAVVTYTFFRDFRSGVKTRWALNKYKCVRYTCIHVYNAHRYIFAFCEIRVGLPCPMVGRRDVSEIT